MQRLKSNLVLMVFVLCSGVFAGEYYNNFNAGSLQSWVNYGGSWYLYNGAYNIGANSNGGKSIYTATAFSNFIYESDVVVSGPSETGLLFRISNPGTGLDNYNGYYASIDASGYIRLSKGPGFFVLAQANTTIKTGLRYRLRVYAAGSLITVFLNGTRMLQVEDASFSSGYIGLSAKNALGTFDNILVSTETGFAVRDDFNDGNENGWLEYDLSTAFSIYSNKYRVSANSNGAKTIWANAMFKSLIVQGDIVTWGPSDVGFLFRATNISAGGYQFNGYYAGVTTSSVFLAKGPGYNVIASTAISVPTNNMHHLTITAVGQNIKVYLNGVLKIDANDNTYADGKIGLMSNYSQVDFDNIAASTYSEAALAKTRAGATGYFGYPVNWGCASYSHYDWPEMYQQAKIMAEEWKFIEPGVITNNKHIGGIEFKTNCFTAGSVTNIIYNLVYVSTHGKDRRFSTYNNAPVYLSPTAIPAAVFRGQTRYAVLDACASLWTGNSPPYNVSKYVSSFKGAHAILGFVSNAAFPNDGGTAAINLVKYFKQMWLNTDVGIFPAWKNAVFEALYYDNGWQFGNGVGVVFTVGM